MITRCPCADCNVHTTICHVLCKPYKEWNEEERKHRDAEFEKKMVYAGLVEHNIGFKEKIRRKKNIK